MRDAILASSVVATFAILSYSVKEYFRVKKEVMLIKALTEFLKRGSLILKKQRQVQWYSLAAILRWLVVTQENKILPQ